MVHLAPHTSGIGIKWSIAGAGSVVESEVRFEECGEPGLDDGVGVDGLTELEAGEFADLLVDRALFSGQR